MEPFHSITIQLGTIYKDYKVSLKQNPEITDKVRLYIHEETKELRLFINSSEAREAGFKILGKGKTIKKIKKELETQFIDSKCQRAAIKALLFLPWKKPIESNDLISQFPIVQDIMNQEKIGIFSIRLSNIEKIKRSEEGGTGVYFINCEFSDELPSNYDQGIIIVKFLEKESLALQVIQADRFIRTVGFVTPKTKFIRKDTELGNKIAEGIRERVEEMGKDNEEQIIEQINKRDIILVMNKLKATSMKLLPVQEVLDLLAEDEFILQIGEMIITDTFINNNDRIGANNCNLGNIMVDENHILNLVDQEFKLTPDSIRDVKENLANLLQGNDTENILITLIGALSVREDKVRLNFTFIDEKKDLINQGMRRGATRLCRVLSNPFTLQRLFHSPSLSIEGEQACDLIRELLRFLQEQTQ